MPVVTDEVRLVFKSSDTNGDCKISVSKLGDGDYRRVFKSVDTNGDGKISVSELGDILTASSPSREMPLPHLRTQPLIEIVVIPQEPAPLPPPPPPTPTSTHAIFDGEMPLPHLRTQPSFNIVVITQEPAPLPPPPPTPTSTHAIFAFIVATFVSFVPIKFPEARTSSPFETHPTTIIVFFASLISYCSSFWASKRFPIHAYVFHVTMRSAALLALASLLSLLSGSFYRVPYMMLIFYFIGECFQLLPMPWQLACRQAIHRSVSEIPHGPTSAV